MIFSRLMVAKATTAANPFDGDDAPIFQARLRLFRANNATEPATATLDDITDQGPQPVANLGGRVNIGDNVLIGYTVDRRWVRIAEPPACPAEWIKFRYTHGIGYDGILDFWGGTDPSVDGAPTIEYPLGQPCDSADVMAFCDPDSGNYIAVSTESAMLGASTQMNIVNSLAFDGCGINYIYQPARVFPCRSEPALININPALTSVSILTGVALLLPIEGCTGVCTYERVEGEWVLLSSTCSSGCICGPLPPYEGIPIIEVPCVREDGLTPRSGTLEFTSSTAWVCGLIAGSGSSIPLAECPPEV